MPFKSEKQRRYLWANEPEIARDWTDTYGSKIKKADGGISQLVKPGSGRPGYRGDDWGGPTYSSSKSSSKSSSNQAPDQGGHSRFKADSGYYGHTGGVNPHAGWQKDVKNIEMAKSVRPYHNLISDKATQYLPNWMRKTPNWNARTKFLKSKGLLKEIAPGKWDTEDENLSWVHDPDILTSQWGLDRLRELDYVPNSDLHGKEEGGGGEGLPYIWPYQTASAPIEEEEIVETDPINLYAGSYRVRPEYLLAEGGRVPAAYGGIMDTYTGRRKYGFGSFISKPFKAAKKAVKKLTSSPIGKLALLYAAGTYLGGTQALSGQMGGAGTFAQRLKDPKLLANLVNAGGTWGTATESLPVDWADKARRLAGDKVSLWDKGIKALKNPWVTIPAASAVTGLLTAQQPEEDLDSVQGDYDDELAKWEEILAPYKGKYRVQDEYLVAEGGRIGKQEGGLMDLGGMEKDYRNDGGFVPIGGQEKADDVPARISRNEFVFTADAVRSAGGGDIDKGAEVMENVMKNLEAGGKVSEESQGKGGAQEMFEVSERLSEVM